MTDIRARQERTVLRVIPVWGRYGARGPTEISGTSQQLRQLATVLATCEGVGEWSLRAPASQSPVPYDRFLRAIRVERGLGKVRVQLVEDTVHFSGGAEELGLLAENIRWLADHGGGSDSGDAGEHLHIEHYPDHFYLAPDAEPLVFQVEPEERSE